MIAVNLSTHLCIHAADEMNGTKDLENEMKQMAEELSANPMGKLMLGKISWIYSE